LVIVTVFISFIVLKMCLRYIQDETPVRSFVELFGRKPAVIWHDSKLGETLTMFRQEKSHMAIVRDVVQLAENVKIAFAFVVCLFVL
jgi:CBS domain containing-hemolysin-like protein